MRNYLLLVFLISILSCGQQKVKVENHTAQQITKTIFSKNIGDSFTVFINLPNNYYQDSMQKYPVAFLLDANLYFDIVATTVNKYSDVGLAPQIILVGIGYKNFELMDSLRDRDYTYPKAIPEYEMATSGGADKFLEFFRSELIPSIQDQFRTDSSKRILLGHSLGGYFSAYTLLQGLSNQHSLFNSYIAASPSLHYDNYYLLNKFKDLPRENLAIGKLKAYFTFGGLEDDFSDTTLIRINQLTSQLEKCFPYKQGGFEFKCDVYSNLSHMDTQIPTFIKGLQWALSSDKLE